MIRRLVAAAALSLSLAAPAFADTLDVLKQNTLTLTDARGGVRTILLSEDGQMQQTDAAGVWAAGFWSMEERGLCWTARGKSQLCIPLEARKAVGDRWDFRRPRGDVVWTAVIIEGRSRLDAGSGDQKPGDH